MESAEITRAWHDLYVMLGTSAAALIGLFFIATSLHIAEVVSNPVFCVRAYNGTLYLLTLLMQAVLILVPHSQYIYLGSGCASLIAGLSLPLSNAYRYFYWKTDVGRRDGLMISRTGAYGASYLIGLAGAITLINQFGAKQQLKGV